MLTLKILARYPVCFSILMALFFSSSLQAQDNVQISSSDGLLSVRATNVSASELAAELSEELGISVVVTGDAETRVNLDIVEEPVEKALGKLSPNNMLVHDSQAQEIIEVVLMMGDSQSSGGGSSNQFLPSGSPAEGVVSDPNAQPSPQPSPEIADPASLRDPNRSTQAREVAGAARSDANLPNPAEQGQDTPIDPATGLALEQ